ncbi:MAG TPA: lytic transglycosylase domain-containing protein, partial [Ignavibacteriaceae bacterium]|nr:lytic transglycosylase domain-containing protein [Ignavibacteriaceae bacterium]
QVGTHTKLMREAFKVVKKKQSSKYIKVIIGVVSIAILFGAYSIYHLIKENEQKQLAETIFYDMKTLDLEIAALKENLSGSDDPTVVKALEKFDERRRQLEKNYEKLVDDLGVYNLNEEDKLIVKTARIFGECEFAIPQGFIDEVKSYIKKWQSTDRYERALDRAKQNGYTQLIVNYLIRNRLPQQFFYLAMQESDFIEQRIGPPTRYGHAKGIWQFIAETGKRYGLTIGKLADQNIYDAGDDRFNLPKSTSAAARYLKDIYNTDAQASGLLVMASYNWGEHRVIDLIRKMPENPRERNFWKLLEKYKDKIPTETYNYVFYIFSAAVIGENPRLFGFDFDNPLVESVQNLNN